VLSLDVKSLNSEIGPHWWPHRGLGPMPPTDPVIYRLYEVCHLTAVIDDSFAYLRCQGVLVYGQAIKVRIAIHVHRSKRLTQYTGNHTRKGSSSVLDGGQYH
jgi:hypothetical protein